MTHRAGRILMGPLLAVDVVHMRLPRLALTLLVMLLVPAAAQARDRDHDKLPDRWERTHHLSTKKKSAGKDGDRDGLSNLGEYRSKTDPRRKDTDRDGRGDGDEDPDRDHVDNDNEMRERTRPRDRDSDDDRRNDGLEDRDRDGLSNAGEDATGNDPKDRDSDDDGIRDGAEQAGVVTSFSGGVLTIGLAGGGSLAGLVVAATDIECQSEDEAETFKRARGSASRSRAVASVGEEGDEGKPPGDESLPGDDDDPGDGGPSDDGDQTPADFGANCTSADLVPGARVQEAEARTSAGGLVFTTVGLVK